MTADDFDDPLDDALWHRGRQPRERPTARARASVARLMSRLYGTASAPLRARMLTALLRPLGPLGLAAIAAGAFAGFVRRSGADGVRVALDDVARYSNEQIVELARFVEQVSPEALLQAANLVAESGVAAFSVSVAMLLLRALQRRTDPARPTFDEAPRH